MDLGKRRKDFFDLRKIYAEILKAEKREHCVPWEKICVGVCSHDVMKRFVTGKTLPEKLTRDRLLERAGLSAEGYENYLRDDEYRLYEERGEILYCVSTHDIRRAQKLLNNYDNAHGGKLERQFSMAMRGQLMIYEGYGAAELQKHFYDTVKITYPEVKSVHINNKIMSVQEISLLLELARYTQNEREAMYEEILDYIKRCVHDESSLAKILPRAVYYICADVLMLRRTTKETCRRALNLCNDARKALMRCERFFYLYELLSIQVWALDGLRRFAGEDEDRELLHKKEETYRQMEMYDEVCRRFGVILKKDNYCYIYEEPGVSKISAVVRIRRVMFGLTDHEAFDDVCAEKTLHHVLRGDVKTYYATLAQILYKLKLPGVLQWKNVITDDPKVQQKSVELGLAINGHDIGKAEKLLGELSAELDMDYDINRQFVGMRRLIVEYYRETITAAEYVEGLKKVFEYTCPLEAVFSCSELHFSMEELKCLNNIALVTEDDEEKQKYIAVLCKVCEQFEKENTVRAHVGMYCSTKMVIANYLSGVGRYDESDTLYKEAVGVAMNNMRLLTVDIALHKLSWNNERRLKLDLPVDDAYDEKRYLEMCRTIYRLAGSRYMESFIKEKFKTLV